MSVKIYVCCKSKTSFIIVTLCCQVEIYQRIINSLLKRDNLINILHRTTRARYNSVNCFSVTVLSTGAS